MKHLPLLAALLLLVALVSVAQEDKKGKTKSGGSAEDQVKALLDQRREATIKADVAVLDATTADDYTRISPTGEMLAKAAYLQGFKDGSVKYESIETKDLKIRVYGDTAVITGIGTVKSTNKGQDTSGTFAVSQVFVKRKGKWQAVQFQATKIPG
jgi:ketosteroid isomerase-like protein